MAGARSAARPPQRREAITYGENEVPITRAAMREVYIALKPPTATPYIMAPRDMEPQAIVDFFAAHAGELEELRDDMLKRFAKSTYGKCRFQTGDVAYVLGRPFQLRVYQLGQKKGVKGGARGRATAKFNVNANVSLLTLYVVHPKNYDEAKVAFNSYARSILLKNAEGLVRDFARIALPEGNVPAVRLRDMRGRWATTQAGALWLSNDLVPYPPDCLVYVLWQELCKDSPVPREQLDEQLHRMLPGWENARRILAERPEPYSLQ